MPTSPMSSPRFCNQCLASSRDWRHLDGTGRVRVYWLAACSCLLVDIMQKRASEGRTDQVQILPTLCLRQSTSPCIGNSAQAGCTARWLFSISGVCAHQGRRTRSREQRRAAQLSDAVSTVLCCVVLLRCAVVAPVAEAAGWPWPSEAEPAQKAVRQVWSHWRPGKTDHPRQQPSPAP